MSKSPSVCRNDEEYAGFVELYRVHECLWNTECPSYRSRAARHAAYRSIARKIGAANTREVAQRIRFLRNAYLQELKRIEQEPRGHEAKPWFQALQQFLGPILRSKQTDSKPERFERTGSFKEQLELFASKDRLELSASSNCPTEPLEPPGTRSSRSPTAVPRSKNGRSGFPGDEYARFGEYVGAALTRMPFEYAISAETEIHRLIVKYRVYAMKMSVSHHHHVFSEAKGDRATGSSSGFALAGTERRPGAQDAPGQGGSSSDTDGNVSESSATNPGPSRGAKS